MKKKSPHLREDRKKNSWSTGPWKRPAPERSETLVRLYSSSSYEVVVGVGKVRKNAKNHGES